MKRFILILIVCCLAMVSFSQELQTLKLDTYFDLLEQEDKFMGTVCVSRDGEFIYSKSLGFSNIETKIKASQNSTYKLGSISKTFTACIRLNNFL